MPDLDLVTSNGRCGPSPCCMMRGRRLLTPTHVKRRTSNAFPITDLLDDGMGPAECSCRGDRATTNTIVQWPWGETHAPITCALFADVINLRGR